MHVDETQQFLEIYDEGGGHLILQSSYVQFKTTFAIRA